MVGDVDGGGCTWVETGGLWELLYFLLNFAVSLNLLWKIVYLKSNAIMNIYAFIQQSYWVLTMNQELI